MAGKNIAFVRKELKRYAEDYLVVNDCLHGESVIKKKAKAYLPQLAKFMNDQTEVSYLSFLNRAVFYGVTARTLKGLVGLVFHKKPEMELPSGLEEIKDNITGDGISIIQLAKIATKQVTAYGRCGILVDYPKTEGATSVSELKEGNIRPVLKVYKSEDIINWRTITIGAKAYFSLIVLKEKYATFDDGFELREETQYKVLSLESGFYMQTVYRKDAKSLYSIFTRDLIVGYDGLPLDEIQFEFIGAENNEAKPCYPPMGDIARLNLGHYRNSADYEESCNMCGQVTPYFTGLTEEWIKLVFEDNKIYLGSRTSIPLPEGATAGLLQANSNTMPYEAMQHKEKQMAALGAKLVEPRKVAQTATEDNNDEKTESSILSTIADNVSTAFKNALVRTCNFTDDDPTSIIFKLNTNFGIAIVSAGERAQTIAEYDKGLLGYVEVRALLKNSGIAFLDDDEVKLEGESRDNNQEKGELDVKA